jgi:glycosyltransferase involved in cell wall biosynthesis
VNYLSCIDYSFVDKPSGAPRVAWDMAMMMRDAGHQVTMLCCSTEKNPDEVPDSEEHGIRILRYKRPQYPSWNPMNLSSQVQAPANAAKRYLSGTKWDVVHAHSPFLGGGALLGLGWDIPLMYTLHSPVVMEMKINWAQQGLLGKFKQAISQPTIGSLEAVLLHKAREIHVLSEFNRINIQRMQKLASKTSVIPHWVRSEYKRTHTRAEAREILGWPQDKPVLFSLRALVPRTGVEVAVEAITPLAVRGMCKFVVGGSGPQREMLEQKARSLGASPLQVEFTGRLSDEDLLLAYQAADLFILPTVELEGFGLIIQEAMAMGLPVLGTDVGAIPELLWPILKDFVVQPRDAVGLRHKVEAFLQGRLQAPSSEELIGDVQFRYGKERIQKRMSALMERCADPPENHLYGQ